MDEFLYFDTRNKKGQKYGNFLRYKKEKSVKSYILLKRQIAKERADLFMYEKLDQLMRSSWYRIIHSHHCEKCHPRKKKVNKMGKEKTIFRKKEYKNFDFDFSVNK